MVRGGVRSKEGRVGAGMMLSRICVPGSVYPLTPQLTETFSVDTLCTLQVGRTLAHLHTYTQAHTTIYFLSDVTWL